MDMKVNSKLIVQYRHQRAWSQQHLSMVAGVSLRTIQRIENEGNASFDTLKAIASAFDTEVNEITQKPFHSQRTSLRPISPVKSACLSRITSLST